MPYSSWLCSEPDVGYGPYGTAAVKELRSDDYLLEKILVGPANPIDTRTTRCSVSSRFYRKRITSRCPHKTQTSYTVVPTRRLTKTRTPDRHHSSDPGVIRQRHSSCYPSISITELIRDSQALDKESPSTDTANPYGLMCLVAPPQVQPSRFDLDLFGNVVVPSSSRFSVSL